MKKYIISVGIGLNMFFQDFYDMSSDEEIILKKMSWSEEIKYNQRVINWYETNFKNGTI